MKWKLIHEDEEGQRTYAVIFEIGDEVVSGLSRLARENDLEASQFTAIGAFRDVTLGYFDWEAKDYRKNPIDEQVEVLTLAGDIVGSDEGPKVHGHVVVGRSDGTAWGGHLLEAHVRPTLEVIVTESPAHLKRKFREDLNLALIAV